MEHWVFQRTESFFNIFANKTYNYIIIYFMIKKYMNKIKGNSANPLILP
jgi:hypothetical protein